MKSVTIPLRPVGSLTIDEIQSHTGVWILFGPTGRMTNLAWDSQTLMKWIDDVGPMYVLKIPINVGIEETPNGGAYIPIDESEERPC